MFTHTIALVEPKQFWGFFSRGVCECYFKYIDQILFDPFLRIQLTNRGHLAVIPFLQSLQATTAS